MEFWFRYDTCIDTEEPCIVSAYRREIVLVGELYCFTVSAVIGVKVKLFKYEHRIVPTYRREMEDYVLYSFIAVSIHITLIGV